VNDSTKEEIGLAVKGSAVRTRGSCNVQIDLLDRSYDKVNMLVMDNLMWDVGCNCGMDNLMWDVGWTI